MTQPDNGPGVQSDETTEQEQAETATQEDGQSQENAEPTEAADTPDE
jgi:hypothetical protein